MNVSEAKKFIQEVSIENRKTWEAIKKNPRFKGLHDIIVKSYPDTAHFLYELLQNAEDAHASYVNFRLEKDIFIVEHDGHPFVEKDINGIVGIGNTGKSEDINAIGRFGIGFKSVFQYTNTPKICSFPFSFQISDLVCIDWWNPPAEIAKEITYFEFPFNNPEKSADKAFEEIVVGLDSFSETTLLFLTHIQRIAWRITPDKTDFIERVPRNKPSNLFEIRRKGKDNTTEWLRFEKTSRECTGRKVAVAFRYEDLVSSDEQDIENKKIQGPRILPIDGQLCIFFPAVKETTGLKFHINAPFSSTPDRASIPHDDAGNKSLCEQIVTLLIESLDIIRDAKILNAQFLDVLPNKRDELKPFFQPFHKRIIEAFQNKPLTPKAHGGHAPSQMLYYGLRNLRDLFNDADLTLLLKNESAWATGVMQNTRGHYFLESLNINELELKSLLDAVGEEFQYSSSTDEIAKKWLISKKPDWLAKFYLLYEEYETMPAIVLSDDYELYPPHRIYLLPEDNSFTEKDAKCLATYPKVTTQIFMGNKQRSQKLREVLCEHGVNILGEEQIVEQILEEYYSRDNLPSEKLHKDHINKFIKFWENNKGTNIFFGYDFLYGEDDKFHSPDDLYVDLPFKKTGLSYLYENKKKILLSDKYTKINTLFLEFVTSLGVQDCILPVKCTFSTYYNPYIYDKIKKGKLKKKKVENGENFNFRIPYEILPKNDDWDYWVYPRFDEFNACPEKFGFNFQKSKLLWMFMCRLQHEYLYSIYDLNNSTHFEEKSQIIVFLEKMKWIPDKTGKFHIPKDMTRDMLHDDFPYKNDNGWLDLIGFGENAKQAEEQKNEAQQKKCEEKKQLKNLLKKHYNLSPEVLDSLSKLSPEEQNRVITSAEAMSRKQHAADSVRNPERRIAKSASSHLLNPERTDEVRQRTIRTTAPELTARKTYLKNKYLLNDDGNDVEINWCQLCGKGLDEVSFPTHDNNFYFESVEIFQKGILSKENAAASLLLCPLCSAKYRVLAKKDQSQQEQLYKWFLETDLNQTSDDDPLRIPIHFKNEQLFIEFSKSHFCDIKGILFEESHRSALDFSDEYNDDEFEDDLNDE